MPHPPPKTCQVIKYFVQRLPGKLGRTKLLKLVYLADIESRRFTKRPISDLQYRWYNHGPWDKRFHDYLDLMERSGWIEAERYQYRGGHGVLIKKLAGMTMNLSPGESAILDYVISEYGQKERQELVEEIAYETEPMKDAVKRRAFRKPLRMSLVDGESIDRLGGFGLEDLARGLEEVREGRAVSLKEALDAVEGQVQIFSRMSRSGVPR